MLEDYQDKMNCSDWIFNELQVRHHSDFGSVDDSLVKEEISQVLAFYVVRAGEPCDAQEQHLEPHYIIKIASRHLQDLTDSDVWHVCELYAEYLELLVGAARRAEA